MKEVYFANIGDDYYNENYRQCGEVFLSLNGNIVFHCTLCDSKCDIYNDFQEYVVHIKKIHIESNVHSTKLVPKEKINVIPRAPAGSFLQEKELITGDSNKAVHPTVLQSSKVVIEKEIPKEEGIDISEHIFDIRPVENKSTVKSSNSLDFDKILESVDLQIKKKRYKRENRKFKCPLCDFAANDNSNLAYHIRRHSIHKPHKCSNCERAFYTKSELKTHQRTHTGERPFLCPFCGRSFMTSGMLSDHVKRHKNLREKECTVCSMKFYSAKQLRAHIVVHSELRLHKCSECEKGFKQRVALKNHMKLHANKKEYQCEFCNSSFNQSSGLYSHMKNKHTNISLVPESQYQQTESNPYMYAMY